MSRRLPPAVRIFISSTFADMENERNYFNKVLAPQLARICEEKGVSFFSVDLRWGITEEEQMNGKVLPICLGEIDKCRPFFIGILGNRYGSTLDYITESLVENFPWLKGKEGKSITELEMLYGVLEYEKEQSDSNCAFFFRDDSLSRQFYPVEESETAIQKLAQLKQNVKKKENIPGYEYSSLDEFGTKLIEIFRKWLEKEFPTIQSVKDARKEWYNSELQRDYYEIEFMNQFLNNYLSNSKRTLLIYGEGQRGKTSFLTNWAQKQENSILINCNSDDEFHYWPAIAHEMIRLINQIEDVGYPQFDAPATMFFSMMSDFHRSKNGGEPVVFYVTDEERESFRKGFVKWLQNLEIKTRINIIISDINSMTDKESYYLSWLPVELPDKVRIICTANSDRIRENAKNIGWNCMEMPLFDEKYILEFLSVYMQNYGKTLSAEQKMNLAQSKVMQYPGYLKFIMKFLIVYGKFENLDYLTSVIGKMQAIKEIYSFILEYITKEVQEKELIYNVLGFCYYTSMGLREEECQKLVSKICSVNALTWSKVRVVMEQFEAVNGEYWRLDNSDLAEIVKELPMDAKKINVLLGEYFEKSLKKSPKEEKVECIRKNTRYARASIEQYSLARDWKRLSECLQSDDVLYYLVKVDWKCVRVAWMKILLESDLDVENIILQLLKRKTLEDRNIAIKLSDLLFDLEMYDSLKEVEGWVGRRPMSDMRFVDTSKLSHEFIRHYSMLAEMKERGNYKGVYLDTCSWLKEEEKLNEQERLLVYLLKEESEAVLKLYEQAMETSAKSFVLAVKAMDIEKIMSSLMIRGNCFMQFGNLESAKRTFAYIQGLALEEGYLREYLATKNLEGMCLYREEKYEEAMAFFDGCIGVWEQVKNRKEAFSCKVNRCNAINLSGKKEQFLLESRKFYEEVEGLQDRKYERHRMHALSLVAQAEAGLQHMQEAETVYLQIIDECKKTRQTHVLESSCLSLRKIYREQNLNLKAAEISQILLEFYFLTQRFQIFIELLQEEVLLLRTNKYDTYADELYARWKMQFMKIPNGEAIFEQGMKRKDDEMRLVQLKEELAVAKSASDAKQQGTILRKIAQLEEANQPEKATNLYMEAAECFLKGEERESSRECAIQAVTNIFKQEKDYSIDRRKECYKYLAEVDLQIIDLWIEGNEIRNRTSKGCVTITETVLKVSDYKDQSKLVYMCIQDFTHQLIAEADKKGLIQILENLEGLESYHSLKKDLFLAFDERYGGIFAKLMQRYIGEEADSNLRFLERSIEFFLEIHKDISAMIAGNIALIFRRRREKEKTFYYHKLSKDIYKELGKERDSFIEAMNLATAHREFGQNLQAVEVLRETLIEVENSQFQDVYASVAGNLAGILIHMNQDGSYEQEILKCFEIEENYFRKAGEQRELATSLLNQLVFYLKAESKCMDKILPKYMEAKAIVEKYKINEYMRALYAMGEAIERLMN